MDDEGQDYGPASVEYLPDIRQVLTAPRVASALALDLTLAFTLAGALSSVSVASGKSSASDCGTTPLCGGGRGGDEEQDHAQQGHGQLQLSRAVSSIKAVHWLSGQLELLCSGELPQRSCANSFC